MQIWKKIPIMIDRMIDRMIDQENLMTDMVMTDRKIDSMTGSMIGQERQMKNLKETNQTQEEDIEAGEMNQTEEPLETSLETFQGIAIDIEDSQKEAAALKIEEGDMTTMEIGIGRPAMVRADTEKVARSP